MEARDTQGRTALYEAVLKGLTDTVRCLARQGARVNAQDLSGGTILHVMSAWKPDAALAAFFLTRQPSLALTKDRWGRTPLM